MALRGSGAADMLLTRPPSAAAWGRGVSLAIDRYRPVQPTVRFVAGSSPVDGSSRPKRDIKQSTSGAQKRSRGSHAQLREHRHHLNVPKYAAMAIMSP